MKAKLTAMSATGLGSGLLAALAAALSLAAGPALAQVARSTPGQPEARTAIDLMPA